MTIQENVPLAPYTTLGVGGPARWFVEAVTEGHILAAVQFARSRSVPHFILGGGSNLLVSDQGFPGVVIRFATAGSGWRDEGNGFATITSSAGTDWDAVVRLAVEHNSAGMECLAGIPGSVGGTPVQNVGAYGQEVSHTITRVRAIDLAADLAVDLSPAECGFAYRRSIFNTSQKGRYAITQVVYSLKLGGAPHLEYRDVKQYFAERATSDPTLAETAAAVRLIRARKGMLLSDDDPDTRSAGSFFKNPVIPEPTLSAFATRANCSTAEIPQFPGGSPNMIKISAAWLIERAGFHKGFALGRAGLSSKHVLAIVNRGQATAAEIVTLRDTITAEIHRRFSIHLDQEPVTLGFHT